MVPGVDVAVLSLASVALVLLAAKAHGRQLRLEREAHGHRDVTFGGENHPWVEALWRRDRFLFWSILGILASLSTIAVALAAPDPWWPAALLLLAWSLALSFAALGLASLVRLARHAHGLPPARRPALVSSAAWWIGVGAVAAATAALAWSLA